MFFRIVSDSFARKPRRKALTAAALALGMAVATATLEVALDVGDRLAHGTLLPEHLALEVDLHGVSPQIFRGLHVAGDPLSRL